MKKNEIISSYLSTSLLKQLFWSVTYTISGLTASLGFQNDDISLSEGSTIDIRKPGEEEDEYSEMAEEDMDPENCFPDGKYDS